MDEFSHSNIPSNLRTKIRELKRKLGDRFDQLAGFWQSSDQPKPADAESANPTNLPASAPFNTFLGYRPEELDILLEFRNSKAVAEAGFITDFLGTRIRTDALWSEARKLGNTLLGLPVPGDFHSETAEWIGALKAVRSARDEFVAMELGAGFGAWAIASGNAARLKGIEKIRLYAVEADPQHFRSLRQHFQDNGFDPEEHCLLQAAVGVEAGTAYWPIVANANEDWGMRPIYDAGESVTTDYIGRSVETMPVQIIPLKDLLLREPRWDLVHIDVQGHEVELCQACIDELGSRVHWLVVGLHSRKLDSELIGLMWKEGWILENEKPTQFQFRPDSPTLEGMTIFDGLQVWRNPGYDKLTKSK